MLDCLLLVEGPAAGPWNMGLDEALLDAAAGGRAVLRFYRWAEPTLSLGYFQAHRDRALHTASAGCPLVRRSTGGGAIVHDRELTYALALPAAHRFARRSAELYSAVHAALAGWLAERLVVATPVDRPTAATVPAAEPFLCFARRSVGDLVVGPHKVLGSAQRRRGGLMQHGSLLLARSAAAPELPGLAEVAGQSFDPQEVAAAWAPRIAEAVGLRLVEGCLPPPVLEAARRWQAERYALRTWTEKR